MVLGEEGLVKKLVALFSFYIHQIHTKCTRGRKCEEAVRLDYMDSVANPPQERSVLVFPIVLFIIFLLFFVGIVFILNSPISTSESSFNGCGLAENGFVFDFEVQKDNVLICVFNNNQPQLVEEEPNKDFKLCHKFFEQNEFGEFVYVKEKDTCRLV
jgi:hypothetical protein